MGAADDKLDQLDYYELLQVAPDASFDEIRAAFHEFALSYHPDRFAWEDPLRHRASQVFSRGTEAYRVLTNRTTREHYDLVRARGEKRFVPGREIEYRTSPKISIKVLAFVTQADEYMASGDLRRAEMSLRLAEQYDATSLVVRQKLATVLEALAHVADSEAEGDFEGD